MSLAPSQVKQLWGYTFYQRDGQWYTLDDSDQFIPVTEAVIEDDQGRERSVGDVLFSLRLPGSIPPPPPYAVKPDKPSDIASQSQQDAYVKALDGYNAYQEWKDRYGRAAEKALEDKEPEKPDTVFRDIRQAQERAQELEAATGIPHTIAASGTGYTVKEDTARIKAQQDAAKTSGYKTPEEAAAAATQQGDGWYHEQQSDGTWVVKFNPTLAMKLMEAQAPDVRRQAAQAAADGKYGLARALYARADAMPGDQRLSQAVQKLNLWLDMARYALPDDTLVGLITGTIKADPMVSRLFDDVFDPGKSYGLPPVTSEEMLQGYGALGQQALSSGKAMPPAMQQFAQQTSQALTAPAGTPNLPVDASGNVTQESVAAANAKFRQDNPNSIQARAASFDDEAGIDALGRNLPVVPLPVGSAGGDVDDGGFNPSTNRYDLPLPTGQSPAFTPTPDPEDLRPQSEVDAAVAGQELPWMRPSAPAALEQAEQPLPTSRVDDPFSLAIKGIYERRNRDRDEALRRFRTTQTRGLGLKPLGR